VQSADGAYFTTARKDRLTILDVLRNGRQRVFRLNEEALGWLRQFGVSQRVIEQVGQWPFHQDWSEPELQRRLTEQIADLALGPAAELWRRRRWRRIPPRAGMCPC
jgi:hypothetical protein